MGGVVACLALIKGPVLPMLQEAVSMGDASAASTIRFIRDARSVRIVRYPDSTWYNAAIR